MTDVYILSYIVIICLEISQYRHPRRWHTSPYIL